MAGEPFAPAPRAAQRCRSAAGPVDGRSSSCRSPLAIAEAAPLSAAPVTVPSSPEAGPSPVIAEAPLAPSPLEAAKSPIAGDAHRGAESESERSGRRVDGGLARSGSRARDRHGRRRGGRRHAFDRTGDVARSRYINAAASAAIWLTLSPSARRTSSTLAPRRRPFAACKRARDRPCRRRLLRICARSCRSW